MRTNKQSVIVSNNIATYTNNYKTTFVGPVSGFTYTAPIDSSINVLIEDADTINQSDSGALVKVN